MPDPSSLGMILANDRETERFSALSGKFKHYCPDWDFMAIDETCPEFHACLCYPERQFDSGRGNA